MLKASNNARALLSANITALDTTVVLDDASKFPSEGNFMITVFDSKKNSPIQDPGMEIMLVTDVDGNEFTVTRGQEGTTASAHKGGHYVAQLLTTRYIEELQEYVIENAIQGPQGPTGPQGPMGAGSAIRSYTWSLSEPAIGGIPGPQLKEAHTAIRLSSYVTNGTSVTFNIEERSTIGGTGTDLLSSDQVATVSGASTTSFANSSLAADSWLWLDISAVSGTPGNVVITLSCEI